MPLIKSTLECPYLTWPASITVEPMNWIRTERQLTIMINQVCCRLKWMTYQLQIYNISCHPNNPSTNLLRHFSPKSIATSLRFLPNDNSHRSLLTFMNLNIVLEMWNDITFWGNNKNILKNNNRLTQTVLCTFWLNNISKPANSPQVTTTSKIVMVCLKSPIPRVEMVVTAIHFKGPFIPGTITITISVLILWE